MFVQPVLKRQHTRSTDNLFWQTIPHLYAPMWKALVSYIYIISFLMNFPDNYGPPPSPLAGRYILYVMNFEVAMSYLLWSSLYISIISPRILLYARVGRFSLLSLSGYGRSFNLLICFVEHFRFHLYIFAYVETKCMMHSQGDFSLGLYTMAQNWTHST